MEAAAAAFGNPLVRKWGTLNLQRIIFGLALAPLPSVAVMTLLGVLLAAASDVSAMFLVLVWGLLAFSGLSLWSLVFGGICLKFFFKGRIWISRRDCLVLGVATETAALLVLVIFATIAGYFGGAPQGHPSSMTTNLVTAIMGSLMGAVFFCPLGLLGGAFFWRIAVRPNPLAV